MASLLSARTVSPKKLMHQAGKDGRKDDEPAFWKASGALLLRLMRIA